MGVYNFLILQAKCPYCNSQQEFSVQFHFGDCWLKEYSLGDTLCWGGNDKGTPNQAEVELNGYSGPCLGCGREFIPFEILLENDVLKSAHAVTESNFEEYSTSYKVIRE